MALTVASVITLLEGPARDAADGLWGGLKAVLGLPALSGASHPHLTWHAAPAYDVAALRIALRQVAASTKPMRIPCGPPAVLRGPQCLLYAPLELRPDLLALHARIARAADAAAGTTAGAWAPDAWAPHITLAAGAIPESELPSALRLLAARDVPLALDLTHLTLVPARDAPPSRWERWDLRA